MTTEALKKARSKYDKVNTEIITLKLNKNTDSDILDFLSSQDNKQGTIKAAMREYIAAKG